MSLCNHLAEASLCPMCHDAAELQTLRQKLAASEAANAKLRGQRTRLVEIEETAFHAIVDAQVVAYEAGDDEGTTAYQDAATIVNEGFMDILTEIAQEQKETDQ